MRFTISALVVAGAAAFAPTQQQRAARPSTSLGMVDSILKKHTGQAALDPSVVAQYANLALPTDKGELSCALYLGIKQKYARCVCLNLSITYIQLYLVPCGLSHREGKIFN